MRSVYFTPKCQERYSWGSLTYFKDTALASQLPQHIPIFACGVSSPHLRYCCAFLDNHYVAEWFYFGIRVLRPSSRKVSMYFNHIHVLANIIM